MAIQIKKTGELNTFTVVVTNEDAAKNPHEAQIVFDALDSMIATNTEAVRNEIKIIRDGHF